MAADPFDILGLEARFDVDAAAVQRAYLSRSAELHPDRQDDVVGLPMVGPEEDEGGAAAAALNEARQVLADPEKRAEALLRRLGGPALGEDRSLPPAFLAEIMQIRERIEEDRASGDPERMEQWEDWAEERRRGHIRRVGELFEAHRQSGDAERLREVRRELNVWRYTERLLEQLGG